MKKQLLKNLFIITTRERGLYLAVNANQSIPGHNFNKIYKPNRTIEN